MSKDKKLRTIAEIKSDIDDLIGELLTVTHDTALVSTGWMLLARGAGYSSSQTFTTIRTSENLDFISMLGFAKHAELHVARKFNL